MKKIIIILLLITPFILLIGCNQSGEQDIVMDVKQIQKPTPFTNTHSTIDETEKKDSIKQEKTYCGLPWKKETLDIFEVSLSVPFNYYIIHYGYGPTLQSFKSINTFYSNGFDGKFSSARDFYLSTYGYGEEVNNIYISNDNSLNIDYRKYIETKKDKKLHPKEILYHGIKVVEIYDDDGKYLKSFYKSKGKTQGIFVFDKNNKIQTKIIKSINNPIYQNELILKKDCHRKTYIWKNKKYNFSIIYPIGYLKIGDSEIQKNSDSKFPSVRLENTEHRLAMNFKAEKFLSKKQKSNIPDSKWKEKDIFIFYNKKNVTDTRTNFVIRRENKKEYKDFIDKTGGYVFSRYEFNGVIFDFNKKNPESVEIIKSITTLK